MKKKKHIGFLLKMPVYSTHRNLTLDDINGFVDEFVLLVEKFGWWTGGGGTLIDLRQWSCSEN